MIKLLTITTLGLVLGMSSISFAQDKINALGVQVPVGQTEAGNNLHGDYSSLDDSSRIFGVHIPVENANLTDSNVTQRHYTLDTHNGQYIFVFGVKVPYKFS